MAGPRDGARGGEHTAVGDGGLPGAGQGADAGDGAEGVCGAVLAGDEAGAGALEAVVGLAVEGL